ncbi:MAG: sigma-70 family RNA polymerase sigma factor [bacterium]
MKRNRTILSGMSDRELIALTQAENPDAFGVLFQRHSERLRSTIYFLIKDRDKSLVDDLVQDAFIKAQEAIMTKGYSERNSFGAWLARIGHNLAVDCLRRKGRGDKKVVCMSQLDARGGEYSYDEWHQLGSGSNREEEIVKDETIRMIEELLEELSPDLRETLILRYYAELPYRDIADITDVSINTSLGRVRYSLKNLRKFLNMPKRAMRKAV